MPLSNTVMMKPKEKRLHTLWLSAAQATAGAELRPGAAWSLPGLMVVGAVMGT